MLILRHFAAAAFIAALFFAQARAVETAERQFERIASLQAAASPSLPGLEIELDVDLAASPGFRIETIGDETRIRYAMAFNNVAEGWSWRPLADPAVEDYYGFKFLPLSTVEKVKAEYEAEDKVGARQHMQVVWRYDYFLAFDNPYDFYPRAVDDDAGFVASIPRTSADKLSMRAVGRLVEPPVRESTTFWKAIFSRPVDFTLKKRYLLVRLEEIRFLDRESGELLAALKPKGLAPQR